MIKIKKAIKFVLSKDFSQNDKLYQVNDKIKTGGLKMANAGVFDWKESWVNSLVKNYSKEFLIEKFRGLVLYGLTFKSINKTEEEVDLITDVFVNECFYRFKYLSISQIEDAIRSCGFGEYGVTAEGLVKCVESCCPFELQKKNRDIEQQIEIETKTKLLQTPQERPLDRKEKIKFLRQGFDFWKKRGYVADIDGDLYNYARELTPQYAPTFADKKKYVQQARMSCYEFFFEKDKFKYQLLFRVEQDKKLLSSKRFKDYLRKQYKEMWLRDFFKRSKWNSQREI